MEVGTESMDPPIFVIGRQHCGNTLLVRLLGNCSTVLAQTNENVFFEHRTLIDREADARQRAERVLPLMNIAEESLKDAVRASLHAFVERAGEEDADAVALYTHGMNVLARLAGKRRWVQKATSYIFYARELLTAMPSAQAVYLERNPWDLAASSKLRGDPNTTLGASAAWRTGFRLSRALATSFPERMFLLRYEQLVNDPERALGELFAKLGLAFEADVLDVPHVNEAGGRTHKGTQDYGAVDGTRGLTRSRLYYYPDVLTPLEIITVDCIAARGAARADLEATYPELKHRIRAAPWYRRVAFAVALPWLVLRFGVRYLARGHGGSLRHLCARTWRRIRLLGTRRA